MANDTTDPSLPPAPPSERLRSIDALRGLDMLCIIGLDQLIHQIARRWDHPVLATLSEQFEHVSWEGFRFYDLIFPLFLFLVGAVLPFSMGKLTERGAPRSAQYGRILRRTVLLIVLGLIANGMLRLEWPFRLAGVLQRIGICYGVAALIYLITSAKWRFVLLALILAGYWALLTYVGVADVKAGDLTIEGNLAGWVDRHYLPGRIMKEYYGYGDNEGILSTIPAIGTTLLGALAGDWLRTRRGGGAKAVGLLLAGSVCLLGGIYWGRTFPIIKNIWTSSFVLVAGGWSLILLSVFYTVIDVLGFRRWSFPFVVIGVNAITIYFAQHFIDFEHMARFFLRGILLRASDANAPIILSVGILVCEWLFLLFLYRHRIFLRV
jgi:predicted acyltransferase